MNFRAIGAIASTTFKGFARDKIFYGVLVIAALVISFSFLISTLTFVETRKILLDFGFTAVSFSGIAVAIFVGVSAVAKEIENRTIYSVLTKPISRWEYLLGKFLGCVLVLIVVHITISAILAGVLLTAGEGFPAGLLPCFFLMLLESTIILSVAILFSVNSDSFLSGCFSFAFFLIGRSNASLQTLSAKAGSSFLKTVFKGIYWLSPNLERYNLRDVVAYGKPYPQEMLPWGALYCGIYIILALALSSWRFRQRDLP
jgi:ABC-type transport system involved in multi-copper enzyme maturation permease subunit